MALESLFALANSGLQASNFQTHDRAYGYLQLALTIAHTSPDDGGNVPDTDLSSLVRCISGAFFNIAGSLYKAQQYASAVRFLKDATQLGDEALKLRQVKSTAQDEGDNVDRENTAWQQLESLLYKRWELLGVCFLKIGDRKASFEIFYRR